MGVLTRTLRDEYKKGIDLTIYLLGTFLALSNFQQFHQLLIDNQIGDATLKIIDFQIKRGDVIAKELKAKLETRKSVYAMAVGKLEDPKAGLAMGKKEVELEIKKYQSLIKKQDKLFCRSRARSCSA